MAKDDVSPMRALNGGIVGEKRDCRLTSSIYNGTLLKLNGDDICPTTWHTEQVTVTGALLAASQLMVDDIIYCLLYRQTEETVIINDHMLYHDPCTQ